MSRDLLAPFNHFLRVGSTIRWSGRITQVVGNLIESDGPFCSVGESCQYTGPEGQTYSGEIIGFRGSTMLSMAADSLLAPQSPELGWYWPLPSGAISRRCT